VGLHIWLAVLTLLAFGAQVVPTGRSSAGMHTVQAGGLRSGALGSPPLHQLPVTTPSSQASRARELLWRAALVPVLFRLSLAVLLGLTPLGAPLLTVLSRTGPLLAYLTTVMVAGILGSLPGPLVRRWRAQAFRLAPQLRPLRTQRHTVTWWLRTALGALAHGMLAGGLLIVTSAPEADLHAFTFVAYCLVVIALDRFLRRVHEWSSHQDSSSVPIQSEHDVARLCAARDSLDLPAPVRDVPVLPGRIIGAGVNAFATHRRGRWTVIVAPELIAELTDRQLRALIGHELGHTGQRPWREKLSRATLLICATFVGSWAAHAIWHPVADWIAPAPLDRTPAYGQALLAAMQIALGYLAFCLLRPLHLFATRAMETAADAAMVRATADPQGCAQFLTRISDFLGSPYHLSLAQRAITATHPSLEERLALVSTAAGLRARTTTHRT
jgi:Zn-dependent protease with chaperone function